MKNKDMATVPFYAFESVQTKAERDHKRLLTALMASMAVNIACIITVARNGL